MTAAMACSRTPKWMFRPAYPQIPPAVPCVGTSPDWATRRLWKSPYPFNAVRVEGSRSADPPPGFANGVGLAIAERWLAARFNCQDEGALVNHWTYVLASDGDMMEGVSSEAASLAGTLRLGRLVVLYDANGITLSADGKTAVWKSTEGSDSWEVILVRVSR